MPASWCSNDCEWNNFWQECREKGENTYVFFDFGFFINYKEYLERHSCSRMLKFYIFIHFIKDVETQALGRGMRTLELRNSYENKMCCAMNTFDPNIFHECQNHPLNECVGFEVSGYRTRCESLGALVEDSYGFTFGGICVPVGIS